MADDGVRNRHACEPAVRRAFFFPASGLGRVAADGLASHPRIGRAAVIRRSGWRVAHQGGRGNRGGERRGD